MKGQFQNGQSEPKWAKIVVAFYSKGGKDDLKRVYSTLRMYYQWKTPENITHKKTVIQKQTSRRITTSEKAFSPNVLHGSKINLIKI